MSDSPLPGNPTPGSLVRSFMVTGGRTSTSAPDLSVETIVSRVTGHPDPVVRSKLQFESRSVYDFLDEASSIAEISAHFRLPILATLVLIGDMVAQGVLTESKVVDEIDTEFLMRLRRRIEAI